MELGDTVTNKPGAERQAQLISLTWESMTRQMYGGGAGAWWAEQSDSWQGQGGESGVAAGRGGVGKVERGMAGVPWEEQSGGWQGRVGEWGGGWQGWGGCGESAG